MTEKPRRANKKTRRIPLVIGIFLIISGLVSIGWFAWEMWGTNLSAYEAQRVEKERMRDQWTASPSPTGSAAIGEGIALMRIPDLGADWEQPVLNGVDPDTLTRGVGWYPTSAMPGQVGNFAVAGHRSGNGRPFDDLLTLSPGATIEVETRTHIYTYELDQSPKDLTVQNTDTWVIDPVPGKKDEEPTKALITLTTCQDFFTSPDRSIGFGHLVETKTK